MASSYASFCAASSSAMRFFMASFSAETERAASSHRFPMSRPSSEEFIVRRERIDLRRVLFCESRNASVRRGGIFNPVERDCVFRAVDLMGADIPVSILFERIVRGRRGLQGYCRRSWEARLFFLRFRSHVFPFSPTKISDRSAGFDTRVTLHFTICRASLFLHG